MKQTYTEREKAIAIGRVAAGESQKDVAKELGMLPRTLSSWCIKAGIRCVAYSPRGVQETKAPAEEEMPVEPETRQIWKEVWRKVEMSLPEENMPCIVRDTTCRLHHARIVEGVWMKYRNKGEGVALEDVAAWIPYPGSLPISNNYDVPLEVTFVRLVKENRELRRMKAAPVVVKSSSPSVKDEEYAKLRITYEELLKKYNSISGAARHCEELNSVVKERNKEIAVLRKKVNFLEGTLSATINKVQDYSERDWDND